jgi:transposase-like protein
MNVDKNPAYPAGVEALKAEGALPRRVRLRQCKYLNNVIVVIEQDHRLVKKRVWIAKGYGSFQCPWHVAVLLRKSRLEQAPCFMFWPNALIYRVFSCIWSSSKGSKLNFATEPFTL